MMFGHQTFTYNELAAKIRDVSQMLVAFGVQADVPVALVMERCPEMIIAIYATLQAGGFYIPLDPSWPKTRHLDILQDSNTSHLITTQNMKVKVPEEYKGHTFCLDNLPFYISSKVTQPIPVTSKCAVYCLYTSGTTGNPKGVIVEHRGLVKRIQWLQVSCF